MVYHKTKFDYFFKIAIFFAIVIVNVADAWAASNCMDMRWRRGKPYNYYASETRQSSGTYQGGLLYLVESAHFNKNVRRLIKGSTGMQPSDLLFVLGSIPNHPAALDAYARYEYLYNSSKSFRKNKSNGKPNYDAECFFKRASVIFPKVASTYLTWGLYYFRKGQYEQALEKFIKADNLSPNSSETLYNIGLTYVNLEDLENTKKYAKKAYDLGYPLDGLKNKIKQLELKNSLND